MKVKRVAKKLDRLSLIFSIKPNILTFWVGILFTIGSFCFILGSLFQLYWLQLGQFLINLTFFIGSIFFTTAAYGQLLLAINANLVNYTSISKKKRDWRWWARGVRSYGFASAFSQFIGTILFNFNTFDAMQNLNKAISEELLIWVPDFIGSILFLISSFFAWLEIRNDGFVKSFISFTWWIVWLNIFGSIFFQASAIYGFIDPKTNTLIDANLSILYTLFGAICFFIAAIVLAIDSKWQNR